MSKENIKKILELSNNLKPKIIIELLYSSELRLSELLNLKRKDLDFDRNIMRLKGTMIADLFEWCKGCRDNKELGSVPKKKEFKNLYVFSGK